MATSEVIAFTSLGLNLLIAIIGATWGIGKISSKLQETFQVEIDGHKQTTVKAVESLQKLISENELSTERKIGETGASLRTKITEVELHIRDNFVRRDTFQEMIRLMSTNMQTQFERLEASINRLSDKLDRQKENGL